MANDGPGRTGNRILDALPEAQFARLEPDLEHVAVERHVTLSAPGEEIPFVYFPVKGVTSMVAEGAGGEQVDTAIIGNEGMIGLQVFLGTGQMPTRAMVQITMEGFRLPSEKLRQELDREGVLLGLLQRYTQMVLVQMAQLILCNRAHNLEQRTARWLLQINVRVDQPPFDVTQEFLAEMLGVNRPPVTEAMKTFREEGLITYTRGSVTILDVEGLERRGCDCYRIIEDEVDRLIAASPRFEMGSGPG